MSPRRSRFCCVAFRTGSRVPSVVGYLRAAPACFLHSSPRGRSRYYATPRSLGRTPPRGLTGGLPELPGVLVRWALCIAAMVAVVHVCGVKAKGQSFTIPRDARSRLIALMQALGIFGAFALVVWIEYMMTPLTLMFETVYAGPTAVYSGDGVIPLHLFLSSSLSAIFLGLFLCEHSCLAEYPRVPGHPRNYLRGGAPLGSGGAAPVHLSVGVGHCGDAGELARARHVGTLLACVGYSLWIVLVATSGDPFDLSANMSRVLVILGFPLAFIVVGGGIYRSSTCGRTRRC